MTSEQRTQLQGIENVLSAMVAELNPRVIMPSLEKQNAHGISEETMLIPVGSHRAITVSATPDGGWWITEFETGGGVLSPIWEQGGALSVELVISTVLGVAVKTLHLEIADGVGNTAELTRVLALLTARRAQLDDRGLASFEFEADEPGGN